VNVTYRWWHGSARSSAAFSTAGWVAGVAIFAVLLVHFADAWRDASMSLARVRAFPVIGAFALLVVAYTAQALGWHVLSHAAQTDTSLRIDVARWCLSLLGKYLPGKIWQAAGRFYLYRDARASSAAVASAFVLESLAGIAAAGAIAATFLCWADTRVPMSVVAGLAGASLLAIAVTISPAVTVLMTRLARRVIRRDLDLAVPIGTRVQALTLNLAASLTLGVGCYVLAQGFTSVPASLIPVFVGSLCAAGLAGMAAVIVPAGLGVRDGVLVWLLASYVPFDSAIVIAVAARLWITGGELCLIAAGRLLATARRHDARGVNIRRRT